MHMISMGDWLSTSSTSFQTLVDHLRWSSCSVSRRVVPSVEERYRRYRYHNWQTISEITGRLDKYDRQCDGHTDYTAEIGGRTDQRTLCGTYRCPPIEITLV